MTILATEDMGVEILLDKPLTDELIKEYEELGLEDFCAKYECGYKVLHGERTIWSQDT